METDWLVPPFAGLALLIALAMVHSNQKNKLLSMLDRPLWLLNLLLVAAFSTYVFSQPANNRVDIELQSATRKALVALLIGLISEAGLTIVPFWAVLVFAYVLDEATTTDESDPEIERVFVSRSEEV
jgi:hypothetical protein